MLKIEILKKPDSVKVVAIFSKPNNLIWNQYFGQNGED